MDIFEKWDRVRLFYESAYRINFKSKPKDEDILMLYKKMKKLQDETARFYSNEPVLFDRFSKRFGEAPIENKTK